MSPDIRPNRRYDHRPKDNLSTSARVVGIAPYEGIKTDLEAKPADSIEVYGKIREHRTDKVYSEDYPRNLMTSATITTKYVPKKGNRDAVQKVHQSQSTILNTINQEKAQETNAHDEYIQSFKHTKDIRDQVNSEQNIITWKKQFIPKVNISLASTRSSLGHYNNDFQHDKAKKLELCGAYTPNYGLNKKFVFQHKANMD